MDLSNAFWSVLLPAWFEGRFRFRFGGKLWDMKRLPFGWKYSPVICQQLLGSLVRDLIPPDILLIHYLDIFLLVARDRAGLRDVTGRVAARLWEAKFLVSPKSTLEPTKSLHCLGKSFDVEGGAITNSQLSLAKLVLAWLRLSVAPPTQRRLQSFMGSLQWAMQPRTGLGPMATGSLAWVVWGSERCDGLPAGVSEALAQLIGHVMLPWRPAGGTLGWTLGGVRTGLGFGKLGGVLAQCGIGYDHPVLVHPSLFVDAAWDSLRGEEGYRLGLFSPKLGTRVDWLGTKFSLGSRARTMNQQMAELWGVWTAVRLDCHMGWGGGGRLLLDNARAIYQGVRGRASVGLWVQQWILRKVNLLLFTCPVVVHFLFVPTFLQPADPVSRFEASCGGCRARALRAPRDIWPRLGDNLSYALYIGSVARYVGSVLGKVMALPRELEGGGGEDLGLFGSAWVSGRVERVGGFIRFVGAKGLWVWLPERPPDPCGRCTAAGVDPWDCWHWGVDCPQRGVRA